MNISQLECFLSVADHLSFAKAAEELSISQPAASHQIQSLENELGGKLFHRTTRTVTLTEAGREFLDDARRMVAIARTAVQRFENPEERERMPLNMGCPSGLMSGLICEGLAKLRDAYENLNPAILTVSGPLITTRTEEGAIDGGLWFEDLSYKKEALRYREICRSNIICAFDRKTFPKICVSGGEINEKDAGALPLILCCGDESVPEILRIQERIAGDKSPSELFFCDSIEGTVEMARAGFGAAIIPEIFVKDDDKLEKYKISGHEPLSVGLYYRAEEGNEPLRQMAKILKELSR